jgi:two-component system response regulator YesN
MYSAIIVDDEFFVRKGLIEMIDWEGNGFQITGEADNGEDALALIREKKPQLVITDIRMPVLDGIGLIQTVAGEGLDTNFIIISGYNDFRYAQQAVRYGVLDYVLKPVDQDDIVNTLAKLREKLARQTQAQEDKAGDAGEKLIEALIRGDLSGTAVEAWTGYWRDTGVREFSYMLVEINNASPWNDAPVPTKEQLAEDIKKALQSILHRSLEHIFVYAHHRAYGFIAPDIYYTERFGSPRELARELGARLAGLYPLELRIYTGKPVQELRSLRDAYTSAKQAMQYKFIKHKERVIAYGDVENAVLNYIHLEDDCTRELIQAVEEGEGHDLASCIRQFLQSLVDKHVSPEAMKTAVDRVVAGIVQSIRSMDGDEKALKSLEPMIGWHDYSITLEELEKLLHQFAAESSDTIARLRKTFTKGNIHKIKQYVDANFQKNMNLKSIAAKFFMNPVYLGQLFKKTYGVYFNDHVQQLRISEAKKLLRQTDKRVYEIAELVGFNNADYFVTQFEKMEQMTPTEYRNRIMER